MCTEHAWRTAHRELTSVAKQRGALDFQEAKCILAAQEAGAHRWLGFGSFLEYLERSLGYAPRLAQEKIRVAEALGELPGISAALRDGELHWSAVRILTRVATGETEAEWLARAEGLSVRELERLVAGREYGDRPADVVKPELIAQRLFVEVLPETMALWREAIARVRQDAGESISDDEAIRMIARIVLEGPKDEGRASHQIVLTRCEDCARTTQRGAGEAIDVDEHVFAAASCDAQLIDLREAEHGHVPRAKQEIPPATRRFVIHRDGGRCKVPGCRHSAYLDLHHLQLRSKGGTHDATNLITVCTAHHAQAHEGHLLITGNLPNLQFLHTNGAPYGLHPHHLHPHHPEPHSSPANSIPTNPPAPENPQPQTLGAAAGPGSSAASCALLPTHPRTSLTARAPDHHQPTEQAGLSSP